MLLHRILEHEVTLLHEADKRSKQHYVRSNSRFNLHSPKAIRCCFREQQAKCSLSKEVCLYAGDNWLKLICQSQGGDRSNNHSPTIHRWLLPQCKSHGHWVRAWTARQTHTLQWQLYFCSWQKASWVRRKEKRKSKQSSMEPVEPAYGNRAFLYQGQ